MLKMKHAIFLEYLGVRGGIGKSTSANRARDHFKWAGVSVYLVRIESKRCLWTPQTDEVFIATEDLAESNDQTGGVAATLAPIWKVLDKARKTNGVVICDWGAGLTNFRSDLLRSTGFDEVLNSFGVVGYACIVTDNSVDSLLQCADTLKSTRDVAPGLHLVVIHNEVHGHFDFADGTVEARALAGVMEESAQARHIKIPAFRGNAMAPFIAAGLTVLEVMTSDPQWLATKIGRDIFVTKACVSKVAEWWKATESEFSNAFPAPTDMAP
ncbi:hypothetical protein [uncultured Rhodoblastus sp.]|uniref:hypothetical protein n=1 Tax=uncultured Rhodoblastus sp. TaxID=543037 RepID=UPI0025E43E0C|nr:hypothetical protein [uncultured Rhodoblastus sp.]